MTEQSHYTFISRFLDGDVRNVNASIKDFLLKDGSIQILIHFITQNFPPNIKRDDGTNQNKQQQQQPSSSSKGATAKTTSSNTNSTGASNASTTTSTTTNSSTSTTSTATTSSSSNILNSSLGIIDPNAPIELIRSIKVVDLFVHPTPPFISLAKDKLNIIIHTLFSIFKYKYQIHNKGGFDTNVETTTFDPKGSINHFCKVIQCLFAQFTFNVIDVLGEIYPPAQKTYFQVLIENIHHPSIQDLLIIISKRASRSVNEYQTTNPMDTKKIQKGLTKSKFYQHLSNYFSRPTSQIDIDTNYLVLDGCSEFMIRCIDELNIYGPDIGLSFCYLQTKDFAESLAKLIANEAGKKSNFTFAHRQMALRIINTMVNKSIDYSNNNQFQAEKDSIFSSGGTTSWLQLFSTNHLTSFAKLLLDMANDQQFKKTLTSFRVDVITLLVECIKQRGSSKKKSNSQNYITPELWVHLVDWFFLYNNIYHAKFYNLIIELINQNHLPSIKQFCTIHLKRFIQFYQENNNSECRGIILLLCNYIRLTADTQQASQYLPTFIKGSEQWNKFLPFLLVDTYKQYHSMSTSKLNPSTQSQTIDYTTSNILVQDLSSINLGSEFAESIGFEDENKKLEHINQLLNSKQFYMIDELNNAENGGGVNGSQPKKQFDSPQLTVTNVYGDDQDDDDEDNED